MSRTITGTIRHVYGTVWEDVALTWTLLEQFKTAAAIYPEETFTINTGVDGTFSVQLATPDSGTAHYKVKLPDETTHELHIDSGPAMDLAAVLIAAGGAVAVNEVQALLDSVEVFMIRSVSTTGAILATDEYVRASGTITLTLPEATGSGWAVIVKNVGTGVVTVDGYGSETIDGLASISIGTGYTPVFIDVSTGQWDMIGGE